MEWEKGANKVLWVGRHCVVVGCWWLWLGHPPTIYYLWYREYYNTLSMFCFFSFVTPAPNRHCLFLCVLLIDLYYVPVLGPIKGTDILLAYYWRNFSVISIGPIFVHSLSGVFSSFTYLGLCFALGVPGNGIKSAYLFLLSFCHGETLPKQRLWFISTKMAKATKEAKNQRKKVARYERQKMARYGEKWRETE